LSNACPAEADVERLFGPAGAAAAGGHRSWALSPRPAR
jgi:hypothetical protein